mgnify:CR=1 FL=1
MNKSATNSGGGFCFVVESLTLLSSLFSLARSLVLFLLLLLLLIKPIPI